MKLDDIVKRVSPDVEKRVEQARQRFNGLVRNILREEMALRLALTGAGDTEEAAKREVVSVPVKICPGAPADAGIEINLDGIDALAILIGQHRITLERLKDAILLCDPLVENLRRPPFEGLMKPPFTALQDCRDWSVALLERLQKAQPLKRLLDFKEDILGRYIYRLPVVEVFDHRSDDPFKGEIELYWGVIGLCAQLLNCAVEDLTVVVLAHELAHAYTHIGADIDGVRWSSQGFSESDLGLKEGLAQYYTRRVCGRLAGKFPGCIKAFEDLLPLQPAPYRSQEAWIAQKASPEHVRMAMLEVRRHGKGELVRFQHALGEAVQRLVRSEPRTGRRR